MSFSDKGWPPGIVVHWTRRGLASAAVAVLWSLLAPYAATSASDSGQASYIVVYKQRPQSVDGETAKREKRLGFRSEHRYRAALQGFAADLTRVQVDVLERDPEVAFVAEDRRLALDNFVPLASGEPIPPTGARRIDAATASLARERGAPVAVLDTGIDLGHPDLNARDGTNCHSPGQPAQDTDSHGTFIAGIIGAKNNGYVGKLFSTGMTTGAVGVAPDTEVWAVKWVSGHFGRTVDLICAIDWVAANAAAKGIQVANMSTGSTSPPLSSCSKTTDALHVAICGLTDAGVTVVASAGNARSSHDDPSAPHTPSAYPEVLAVTALSDSDGQPGATGGPPQGGAAGCYNATETEDDVPATFSNFAATEEGSAHTIAAPGVCITSTIPSSFGADYSKFNGTSFAAPHAAAVAALCHEEGGRPGPCAHKRPEQVIKYLMQKAASYNQAHPEYGFLHDPQHSPVPGKYYGYLIRAPHASD